MSRLCGRAAATRLSRLCGRAAAMTTWQRPQHLAHGVCRRFVASEASRITIYTKTGDKGRSSLFTGYDVGVLFLLYYVLVVGSAATYTRASKVVCTCPCPNH